jgi:hypothetical protein
LLPQPNVTATVAGGETKDIEYIWDTLGFAWEAGGSPLSDRKITVKMNSETLSEVVMVKPKPVVLIGGYWTKPDAWQLYADYLKRTHIDWTAAPVGSFAGVGKAIDPMTSIGENARELETHIRFLRERFNAWHVDAVAHSTGGLIRSVLHSPIYEKRLHEPRRNRASADARHANNGTLCAQIFRKKQFDYGQTDAAMSQLLPEPIQIFNRDVINRNRTRFSALAGRVSPITCVRLKKATGFAPGFFRRLQY